MRDTSANSPATSSGLQQTRIFFGCLRVGTANANIFGLAVTAAPVATNYWLGVAINVQTSTACHIWRKGTPSEARANNSLQNRLEMTPIGEIASNRIQYVCLCKAEVRHVQALQP